jgi:hypothetical protein
MQATFGATLATLLRHHLHPLPSLPTGDGGRLEYRLTLMPRSSYAAMFAGIANKAQRKWLRNNIDLVILEIVSEVNKAGLTPSALKSDSPLFVVPSDQSIRSDITVKKFNGQLPQNTDAAALLNREKNLYANSAVDETGTAPTRSWRPG